MEIKKVISTLAGTALVTGLLVLPMAGFSQGATYAPPAKAPVTNPQAKRMKHERHPEIRRALRALERAKMDLQKGAHDLGGHRAQALQHVDQAIQQCQQALQADQR